MLARLPLFLAHGLIRINGESWMNIADVQSFQRTAGRVTSVTLSASRHEVLRGRRLPAVPQVTLPYLDATGEVGPMTWKTADTLAAALAAALELGPDDDLDDELVAGRAWQRREEILRRVGQRELQAAVRALRGAAAGRAVHVESGPPVRVRPVPAHPALFAALNAATEHVTWSRVFAVHHSTRLVLDADGLHLHG